MWVPIYNRLPRLSIFICYIYAYAYSIFKAGFNPYVQVSDDKIKISGVWKDRCITGVDVIIESGTLIQRCEFKDCENILIAGTNIYIYESLFTQSNGKTHG